MQTHIVYLLPGEDLSLALHRYCKKHRIELAYIASSSVELRQVVLKKGYEQTLFTLEGPFDLVSLEGMVSEHAITMTLAVSDKHFKVYGGRVGIGCIVQNNAHVVLVDISEKQQQDETPKINHLTEIELESLSKACKEK